MYDHINRTLLIIFMIDITNIYIKTRMTTFIKTKFKISDDQTKYRLAANITEY